MLVRFVRSKTFDVFTPREILLLDRPSPPCFEPLEPPPPWVSNLLLQRPPDLSLQVCTAGPLYPSFPVASRREIIRRDRGKLMKIFFPQKKTGVGSKDSVRGGCQFSVSLIRTGFKLQSQLVFSLSVYWSHDRWRAASSLERSSTVWTTPWPPRRSGTRCWPTPSTRSALPCSNRTDTNKDHDLFRGSWSTMAHTSNSATVMACECK